MPRSGHNRGIGRRWRELVALVLEREFPDATPAPVAARLSESFAEGRPASDVLGIPGVAVQVRADAHVDWSTALDSAELAAEVSCADHAVLVEYRRGRPGADAYAVMSLGRWARMAKLATDAKARR